MSNGAAAPGWDVEDTVAPIATITLTAIAAYDQTTTRTEIVYGYSGGPSTFTVTDRKTFSFSESKVWNRAAFPWREDVYWRTGAGDVSPKVATWGGNEDLRYSGDNADPPIEPDPVTEGEFYVMRWIYRPWLISPEDSAGSRLNHSFTHIGNRFAAKRNYGGIQLRCSLGDLSNSVSLGMALTIDDVTVTTVTHWVRVSGTAPTPADTTVTRHYHGFANAYFVRGGEGETSFWYLDVELGTVSNPYALAVFGGATAGAVVEISTLDGILSTGGAIDSTAGLIFGTIDTSASLTFEVALA